MPAINNCRSCKSKKLKKLFNLGEQNYTGIFYKNKSQKVPKGKLELIMCKKCYLVQLSENFNLKMMYGKTYGYRTGLNASMVKHIKNKVNYLSNILKSNKTKNMTVIDIGSNDGTLLNFFFQKKKIEFNWC